MLYGSGTIALVVLIVITVGFLSKEDRTETTGKTNQASRKKMPSLWKSNYIGFKDKAIL